MSAFQQGLSFSVAQRCMVQGTGAGCLWRLLMKGDDGAVLVVGPTVRTASFHTVITTTQQNCLDHAGCSCAGGL